MNTLKPLLSVVSRPASLVFTFVLLAPSTVMPANPSSATIYTVTLYDLPGTTGSALLGINDPVEIVGEYTDHTPVTHGFSQTDAGDETLDIPGSSSTSAIGINDDGDVVGAFVDTDGNQQGFSRIAGHLELVNVPGSISGFPRCINNHGVIAGGGTLAQPARAMATFAASASTR